MRTSPGPGPTTTISFLDVHYLFNQIGHFRYQQMEQKVDNHNTRSATLNIVLFSCNEVILFPAMLRAWQRYKVLWIVFSACQHSTERTCQFFTINLVINGQSVQTQGLTNFRANLKFDKDNINYLWGNTDRTLISSLQNDLYREGSNRGFS